MFRSTGSYEPDPLSLVKILVFLCFDPQALTSLTLNKAVVAKMLEGFDPQALTSLTSKPANKKPYQKRFRSTGSYEPDLSICC